jgi:SSS family solute:Na+ symporter
MFFVTAACSVVMYMIFSLLTKVNPGFSMDKMLHRGAYAIDGDHEIIEEKKQNLLMRLVGIDREYTQMDKCIAWGAFVWTMFWFGLFVVGTIYSLTPGVQISDDGWALYWMFHLSSWCLVGGISVFWFLIFGFRDFKRMFETLRQRSVMPDEDGCIDRPLANKDERCQ